MSEVQTSSGHLEKGRGRNIMYIHRYTIDNHAYKLLCLCITIIVLMNMNILNQQTAPFYFPLGRLIHLYKHVYAFIIFRNIPLVQNYIWSFSERNQKLFSTQNVSIRILIVQHIYFLKTITTPSVGFQLKLFLTVMSPEGP